MARLTGPIGRYVRRFMDDDVMGLAAELAYRFLFAIFPFGLFLAALSAFVAGWLGVSDPTQRIMSGLGDNLPSNLAGPVKDQLEAVVAHVRPDLLSVGAVLALYAAAGGTNALIKAMNRAYEVRETRPIWARLGLAIGLTILGGAAILVSFVTITGGALVTEQVAAKVGTGGGVWTALSLLRWPLVFVVLALAGAILFRYAPNVRPPWRWSLLGSVAFAIGWLVVTFVFSIYVSRFGRFDVTYGALGGVIVLMLWFYLTAVVLVAAAELVALLVVEREPELLQARREATAPGQVVQRAADGARDAAGQAAERARRPVEAARDGLAGAARGRESDEASASDEGSASAT